MTGMPILGEERMLPIPWDVITPHEQQAQRNHDQTLKQLAKRGGLSPSEAVAILEDRPWRLMDEIAAINKLGRLIAQT